MMTRLCIAIGGMMIGSWLIWTDYQERSSGFCALPADRFQRRYVSCHGDNARRMARGSRLALLLIPPRDGIAHNLKIKGEL